MHYNNGNPSPPRLLAIAVLIFTAAFTSNAQSSEFTYQGKITDTTPSSSYDLIFRLCSTETADCSTPLATDSATGVALSPGGVFTVNLDFGFQHYLTNFDRYIEIAVRRSGGSGYTTLSPRTKLTAAPTAVYSQRADYAYTLEGLGASDFIQDTDPRIQPGYNVLNGTTLQSGGNFNIGGTGSAGIVNAQNHFTLNGSRILSNAGQLNLFVGTQAGAVTTGGANAFIGSSAGLSNTTGDNNTFVGTYSGYTNTIGRFNTFLGTSSGEQNLSGSSNSFFGQSAGTSNSTGNSNAFFGASAGTVNSTGSNNTVIGTSANLGAPNLSFATAIGAGSIVSSSNSVVLGRASDQVLVPGSFSSSIVNASSQFNVGGTKYLSNGGSTSNVYLGSNSQCNTANGNDSQGNVFVGRYTALDCTTGSGNTVIGDFAGTVGAGDLNTLIGSSARITNAVEIYNATAIGALARVSKSNTMVLGTPSTNVVIKGDIQVYADQEAPGGGTERPAFQTVTSNRYGRGMAVEKLFIGRFSDPVYTTSPMCVQGGTDNIGYLHVGFCANGTGLSSDKSNVRDFEGGLKILSRLRPVSFRWKDGDTSGIGLNADEVEAIAPEMVERDATGVATGVSPTALNSILINSIKEQQKQIDAQQKQIEMLKKIICGIKPDSEGCMEAKQ